MGEGKKKKRREKREGKKEEIKAKGKGKGKDMKEKGKGIRDHGWKVKGKEVEGLILLPISWWVRKSTDQRI